MLPIVTIAVLGGSAILAVSVAHAQTGNPPWSGLVQMIAQKFNLDQTQVQGVFDQYRQQQVQNGAKMMQGREKARLDQLVKDGKINSTQEQTVIAELASLKIKYNSANFKAEQDEINAWAKTEGIDPTYLRPGFGRGGRGYFGNRPKITPTPTP